MAKIYLETLIKADIHQVFDIARDIDLHQRSTSKTREKAVEGRTSGLIENGENRNMESKTSGSISNPYLKDHRDGKALLFYRYYVERNI